MVAPFVQGALLLAQATLPLFQLLEPVVESGSPLLQAIVFLSELPLAGLGFLLRLVPAVDHLFLSLVQLFLGFLLSIGHDALRLEFGTLDANPTLIAEEEITAYCPQRQTYYRQYDGY